MKKYFLFVVGVCLPLVTQSSQFSLPGSADLSRIQDQDIPPSEIEEKEKKTSPKQQEDLKIEIPKEAFSLKMHIKKVKINGCTIFSEKELEAIYSPILEAKQRIQGAQNSVPLSVAWEIAEKISRLYQQKGYLLSKVYVPSQDLKQDTLSLEAVEGYISQVDLQSPLANSGILQSFLSEVIAKKPAREKQLESLLLKLNDLPGLQFRSVISAFPGTKGAFRLTLIPTKSPSKTAISVDNFSSAYLGPHEVVFSFLGSMAPLNETRLTILSSIPSNGLRYGKLHHTYALAPSLFLETSVGMARARPGWKLSPYQVSSYSQFTHIGLSHQLIRQQKHQLNAKFWIDGKNTTTRIYRILLSEDRVRILKTSLSYDRKRNTGEENYQLQFSHGLDILGASQPEDVTSRPKVNPQFKKLDLTCVYKYRLRENWMVETHAAGQIATSGLVSGEEFGYGGSNFGRAYDASELTGRHGISASVELQHVQLCDWKGFGAVQMLTYFFVDKGFIFNSDPSRVSRADSASSGGGLRLAHRSGMQASIGLAFPVGKGIATPIYHQGHHHPRIGFQWSQSF